MKIKIKAKDYQLLVKVKASYRESIDEKELDRFSRAFFRGFFKPKMKNKKTIEYIGSVGITLHDRLKKPVTKRDFLFILEQIVVSIQKLQANNMSIENVLLNLQYVYINEVTKELQFLYIPISGTLDSIGLEEFVEAVAYSVKPADEVDNEFVSRFMYYFRAMNPFDVRKIESFVSKEDKSVVSAIRKQNAGQSGFMTSSRQHYFEMVEKQNLNEDTMLISQDYGEDTTRLLDEDETALLTGEFEDPDATGLLVENDYNVHFPMLFRLQTEERISINKPVFRLGKEKSYVDYFVNNNIAVSRGHADIITRGNKYFVKDLNSKNHTFINNQELPVYMEIEIHDGDRLKLGNEEFIFYT